LISRKVLADSGRAANNLILRIFLICSVMFSAASSMEREDERDWEGKNNDQKANA